MQKQLIGMLVLVAWNLNFLPSLHAKTLIISGSTTVQRLIIEPNKQAIEVATGIQIIDRGINSGRGFAALIAGDITVSMASSPLRTLLKKAGLQDDGTYQEHVISKDVIVPIVHKSNPLTELTWQQLKNIHTGVVTNWREVGGVNERIVVITSRPTAATRIMFQQQVLQNADYVTTTRMVKSTYQEVNLVAKFKGGIGAVSAGFVALKPNKVKVIKTTAIARPLIFVTNGKPLPKVRKVLDFLMTNVIKQHSNPSHPTSASLPHTAH